MMTQTRLARHLRTLWSQQQSAIGAFVALADPFSAELLCVPGVDYICIDQQHGLIDYAQMIDVMRAVETHDVVPLTRVAANEAWLIGKALDAGIQGVIVPMVNNREEARAAVAACRYGRGAIRSYGPIRAAMSMDSRSTDVLGGDILCFVMVETRQGLDAVEEIAATPGLDGIYIGPADLALGLGLPPDLDKQEPEHVEAVARILRACQTNGIAPGIQCGSGAAALARVKQGFRLVTFTKDSALLSSGIARELACFAPSSPRNNNKGYV